jgi:hypothetical protein
VSIDFAYAQARAQGRLGERLPEDAWRVIESSLGLSQYLASVRGTALAPRTRYFPAEVTPHAIERTLREHWRTEVADVARWIPDEWREAIEWIAYIPYISAVDWLAKKEPVLSWMQDDPVLSDLAVDDASARRVALDASPFAAMPDVDGDLTAGWLAHWRSLWPSMADEEATAMHTFVDAVRTWLVAIAVQGASLRDRRDARVRLSRKVASMMHRHIQQPVVVFCHLLLFGLELQRLRDGLLRRTLFNDELPERVA